MAKLKFAVGHDAEFFISDGKRFVPPQVAKIGGTKDKPVPLEGSKVGTTIQQDGVTVELGMTPCSANEFIKKAYIGFQETESFLAKKGFMIYVQPDAAFEPSVFKQFPELSVLGCNPDNSAWDRGYVRDVPDVAAMGDTRFAAGHLHFSFPETEVPKWAIVQMLDAFALTFWPGYNSRTCGRRYDFYGMPGVYRDKPYGLEYRTPNNSWMIGDGDDRDFIKDCASIIQGISTKTSAQVRAIYDRVDWEAVKNLLDLKQQPTLQHRQRVVDTMFVLEDLKNELAVDKGALE